MKNLLLIFQLIILFIFAIDYRITFVLLSVFLVIVVILKLLLHKNLNFEVYDILVLVFLIIAYTFVQSGADMLNIFLRVAVYPFLFYFLFREIPLEKKNMSRFILAIAIVSFFVFSFLFFQLHISTGNLTLQYLFTRDRQGFVYWNYETIIGPTPLSALIGISIISFLAYYKIEKKGLLIILPFLFFSIIYIIVLSSRTTWIALFLIIFLFSNFKNNRFHITKGLPVIFLVLLVLLFLLFLSPFSHLFQFDVLSRRVQFFLNPYQDANLNARFLRWAVAIELISRNIWGYGFTYYGVSTGLQTPHNEILGTFVSVGVIGLFSIISLYGIILKRIFFLKKNNNKFAIYFIGVFIFVFLTSLTEYLSFAMYNLMNPLIWMIFGIVSNKAISEY